MHACFIFLGIAKKLVCLSVNIIYKHVKGALSVKKQRNQLLHKDTQRVMSFEINDIRSHNAHSHEMKISLLENDFFNSA